MATELMTNETGNARSAEFKHITPDHSDESFSGEPSLLNIYVQGTLNGNTLEVQAKDPNGNFVPIAGGQITSPGMHTIWAASFIGALQVPSGAGHDITVNLESQKEAFKRVFDNASGDGAGINAV